MRNRTAPEASFGGLPQIVGTEFESEAIITDRHFTNRHGIKRKKSLTPNPYRRSSKFKKPKLKTNVEP